MTVAEITDEHRGWLLKIEELSLSPFAPRHRSFVLGKGFGSGVRHWTYEGTEYVGLIDDNKSRGVVGTEWTYKADTPCELVRLVTKQRRRKQAVND